MNIMAGGARKVADPCAFSGCFVKKGQKFILDPGAFSSDDHDIIRMRCNQRDLLIRRSGL